MKALRVLGAAVLLSVLAGSVAGATPFFTQDAAVLPEGRWRVEQHVLYTVLDRALVGGREVPLSGAASVSSLTLNTRLRYGASDKLTVFVDLPWVYKRLRLASADAQEAAGRGDLFLLAKYRLYANTATRTRAAVGVGAKLDTGEYRLPPELALGSGQRNWVVVALADRKVGQTTYYTSASLVLTGTNRHTGVDPGEVVSLNLAAERQLGRAPWAVVAEINYSHQGKSEQAGAPVQASGSTLTSVAAGLQYRPAPKEGRVLVVEAEVQLPVSRRGYARALGDSLLYLGASLVF